MNTVLDAATNYLADHHRITAAVLVTLIYGACWLDRCLP
ncbi:hypothetical protein ACVWWD_004292 [Mesorhizobium sp. URHB0026]